MNRIKELREKSNITQFELAQYLNVTQNTISNYENGIREPDLAIIKKIAKYFNVTIDFLLATSEEDIILITKKDLNELKRATDVINNITNKLIIVSKVE